MRVFPLIVALVLCGCSRSSSEAATLAAVAATPAASQAATATPPPAGPVPTELPDVIARVNGEPIAKADMDRAIQTLERANGPVPGEQRDRILRSVLDQLIGLRLLVQETRVRNV